MRQSYCAVGVGGAAHGTLPWTLEGQTRTTLFYKFNTNGSSWTRNYLDPADFCASRSPAHHYHWLSNCSRQTGAEVGRAVCCVWVVAQLSMRTWTKRSSRSSNRRTRAEVQDRQVIVSYPRCELFGFRMCVQRADFVDTRWRSRSMCASKRLYGSRNPDDSRYSASALGAVFEQSPAPVSNQVCSQLLLPPKS